VFDVIGFEQNCHRVLKPSGQLYLRVPNIAYIKHRLDLLHGQLPVTVSLFGLLGDLSAWCNLYGRDCGHLHLVTILQRDDMDENYAFWVKSALRSSLVTTLKPNSLSCAGLESASESDGFNFCHI
jgi:hypothetical protein